MTMHTGPGLEVIKSPNDKKQYRYIVLENGLRALLIHDPEISLTPAEGADCGLRTTEGAAKAAGNKKGAVRDDASEDSGDMEEGGEDEGSTSEAEGSEEDSDASGDESEGSDESGEGEEEEDSGSEGDGKPGKRSKGKGKGKGSSGATKKAAAAMAVGVGSFLDPPHMQGLSHYLEHMLFMGSKAYPDENDYDAFLTAHGGSSNAFTDYEVTNYHFEVDPPALRDALTRFAHFFIDPLCSAGALEREVCAVDSEFKQVLQDDHCRLQQMQAHTARAGHVCRRFAWGNKRSLWDEPRMAGMDVRGAIVDYYKAQYSAERSCLVLLGGEDLDALAAMAREAFTDMRSGLGPRPSVAGAGPPFAGRSLYVVPAVKNVHELSFTFQLPSQQGQYTTKSDQYISHLLGHEGPGSLLSLLKTRGWATGVCAGVEEDGFSSNTAATLFGVDVTLTEAGLHAAPGAGLAVAGLVFQYIALLRRGGPVEWVWREMAAMADMKFRFLEEGDPLDSVSGLASTLHVVQPAHVLAHEYLHEQWCPDKISDLLRCFDPAASEPGWRIDILTQDYERVLADIKTLGEKHGCGVDEIREPWFDLAGASMQIPDAMLSEWANTAPSAELHLPPPNPYLPTDFSIKPSPVEVQQHEQQSAADAGKNASGGETKAVADAADSKAQAAAESEALAAAARAYGLEGVESLLATPPVMVEDRPGLRLWHKQDTTFRTPRAMLLLRLWSPAAHASPRDAALCHLCLRLAEEWLAEDGYLADVAGLHYHFSPDGMAGIEVRAEGFSHKLPLLAKRLLQALAALTQAHPEDAGVIPMDTTTGTSASGDDAAARAVSGAHAGPSPLAKWAVVKEVLVRKYRNMNLQVDKHATYTRLYALCGSAYHVDELARELEALQPADVAPWARGLLAACHAEMMAFGNVTRQEAQTLADELMQVLGPGCCLPVSARRRDACMHIPAGLTTRVLLTARNPEDTNCALEVYYQVGAGGQCSPESAHAHAVLDLLEQVLYEPCYDALRTKQQLGYSVHSGTRLTHGVSGLVVQVVSAEYGCVHLGVRVEAFMQDMVQRIAGLTEEEVAKHIAAVRSSKLQRDRSLSDEGHRHWEQIASTRYDFLGREAEVAALQSLTKEDLLQAFCTHILGTPPPSQSLSAPQATPMAEPSSSAAGTGAGRRKLVVSVYCHSRMEELQAVQSQPQQPGNEVAGLATGRGVALTSAAAGAGAAAAQASAADAGMGPVDEVVVEGFSSVVGEAELAVWRGTLQPVPGVVLPQPLPSLCG